MGRTETDCGQVHCTHLERDKEQWRSLLKKKNERLESTPLHTLVNRLTLVSKNRSAFWSDLNMGGAH
jgi:hypothetical protein